MAEEVDVSATLLDEEPRPFHRAYVAHAADFPVFNMRNGTPENARSLMVRATVAPKYHWVGVASLPPELAVANVDAYIASALTQLTVEGDPTDDPVAKRKTAICLGVTRAVSTAFYGLTNQDIMPGERASPSLEYVAPPVGSVAGTQGTIREVAGLNAQTRVAMREPLTLTREEQEVVTMLMRVSPATIPMQGYSLVMCNHHYLSDPKSQSFRAYLAIEKQFWTGDVITKWVEEHKDVVRDALWHKACHPINLTLKVTSATNDIVKSQLEVAGIGSAATRLPALETEAKAGDTYLTLFATVRNMFTSYGGWVTDDVLVDALRTVRSYPPMIENPVEPTNRPGTVPEWVVNRRTAVNWVTEIVKRNAASAAQCYGFYVAMSERSALVGTEMGVDTLKSSFALKKLRGTHLPAYTLGYEQFGDYSAARAKARSKGSFSAPGIEIV